MKIEDLAGKRVLITGASTGIGAAAAVAFAAQGCAVAIHYREHEAEARAVAAQVEARGAKAVVLRADLAARGAPQRLVNEAAQALGGLDILINNAGSLITRRPFADIDDALIDSVFDLNVRAVIHAVRAAIPLLEKSTAPSVINVGSIAGLDGGGPGSAVYASSKAFIHNLTRHLARDLGARGIRVNTVSPGVIATPFHDATPPERMEVMRKAVTLGRVGTPQDCVGAFLFFASASLSGYITGQNMHVNGGMAMP
ncbi:MAG: SDR family oxidoreductase [Pseudomonadota bacterium]